MTSWRSLKRQLERDRQEWEAESARLDALYAEIERLEVVRDKARARADRAAAAVDAAHTAWCEAIQASTAKTAAKVEALRAKRTGRSDG